MSGSSSHRKGFPEPPRLARALLRLVIPERDRKYVLADLAEEFAAMLAEGRGIQNRNVAASSSPDDRDCRLI